MRVGALIVRVPEERDAQNKNAQRRQCSEKSILREGNAQSTPRSRRVREARGGGSGEWEKRGARREGEAHREER